MTASKPVTIEYISPDEYEGSFAPQPLVVIGDPPAGGEGGPAPVASSDITDATDVGRQVLTAESAAAARAVIGAGTSDLALGTTASTALAGNTAFVPPTRTVAGKALSANVTLAKADVGLGNVDNTSDANKPVSTATQTALNAKLNANDPRIPVVLTQAAYDALTPVAGQVYIIQG